MAYVRKTDMLVQDIRENVRNMKDKALKAYQVGQIEPSTELHSEACKPAITASYHDAPELEGKLPSSMMKSHNRIQLEFFNEDGERNFDSMLRMADNQSLSLPLSADTSYYGAKVQVHPKSMTEAMRKWVGEANERHAKRNEIAEQYDTVETQLTQYMRQHASLNAAIKEMPEMEMYVPEKYIDKMRAATEPRRKKGSNEPTASEELGIDRDALATMAIAHRLQQ